MPRHPAPTMTDAAVYAKRVKDTAANFDRLGYGARGEASKDLRIPASRVSGVLNYREVNEDFLGRLEKWAADRLSEGTPV